jgi:hypothetical protein
MVHAKIFSYSLMKKEENLSLMQREEEKSGDLEEKKISLMQIEEEKEDSLLMRAKKTPFDSNLIQMLLKVF